MIYGKISVDKIYHKFGTSISLGKDGNMCAVKDKKPGFDSEIGESSLKIRLHGEIDHHTAGTLRREIDEMIKKEKPEVLIIDMSAVDFMDSSGLGLIMGRYALMHESGGEVVLFEPSAAVEKILQLAGMDKVIKIEKRSVESVKRIRELQRGSTRKTRSTCDRAPGSTPKRRKKEVISK